MVHTLEDQVVWVRALMGHLGLSIHGLAKRAGIASSTLQRPLNDPEWPNLLSARTVNALADAAGVKPMELPGRGSFIGTEATPFRFDQEKDAIRSNIDRAVRELMHGRNGREPWVIQGHALELSGVLPGDIVIVDHNRQPEPHDVVCAEVSSFGRAEGETIFRLYEPPYLLTNSVRNGVARPMLVDGREVVVKGVVDGLIRPRSAA